MLLQRQRKKVNTVQKRKEVYFTWRSKEAFMGMEGCNRPGPRTKSASASQVGSSVPTPTTAAPTTHPVQCPWKVLLTDCLTFSLSPVITTEPFSTQQNRQKIRAHA